MSCATIPFGNAGSDPHARTSAAAGRGTRPGAGTAIAGPAPVAQAAASDAIVSADAAADRIPRIPTLSR
jgi:hypothetical protein